MTEPTKGNEHILANHAEFQQTYARAQAYFKQFDGVAGVGFGLKETGGKLSENISIIVYVREKKNAEDLPPDQRIPPQFEGYRTDVSVVDEATDMGCENTAENPVIQGGIQIGISSGEGTLGCIVKRRNDSGRENVYLLTCKHVLYDQTHGANDVVYHPFHPDNGASHDLGPIQPGAIKDNVHRVEPDPVNPGQTHAVDYYVDAAVARINLDSTCCGSTCTKDKTHTDSTIVDLVLNGGRVADVRDVMHDATIIYTPQNQRLVYKSGRTTRRTVGRVVRINHSFSASRDTSIPNSQPIAASNVIQIELDPDHNQNGLNCQGNLFFLDEGDSGSLVVDEDGKAIGLATSTNFITNRSNASHIVAVLDALQVSIVSTGTSHGSTSATDGSGVAVASIPPDLANFPDGQIVFASDAAAGPFGMPALVAVSDDEQRYMRGLLDRLRSTRRGRALHELFGRLRREAGYLVRNHKLVKVAWNRNKGPAFMAHTLDHIKGNADRVPREVEGVSVVTLLARMAEVLTAYGSNPLREAIEAHRDEIAAMLAGDRIHTVDDCLGYLEASEEKA
jgi:hypothetical protein